MFCSKARDIVRILYGDPVEVLERKYVRAQAIIDGSSEISAPYIEGPSRDRESEQEINHDISSDLLSDE